MPRSKLSVIPREPARRTQPPNNLPALRSPLVGREREVEAVSRLLSQPQIPLLTLVGPGGVGKTRLALRVAEELLGEFEDGVYFIDLAPVSEVEQIPLTVAATLQLRETPGTPVLLTLKTHLRGKKMLLVLDNFEHLIPAGPAMYELLTACPDLKALITSRAPLGLRNEQEFLVSPLAMPEPGRHLTPTTLLEYGAIALFAQRAGARPPPAESDFELTPDNANAVVEICRRVDGLPLAIELVAAHARLQSPQSLLARLTHPLRLLTGGHRDASGRHRTLRDTIEWSYKLLDEDEQRLFRCLSVFVGGFTIPAAEAVCNAAGDISIGVDHPQAVEVLEGIQTLVDNNLLRRLERTDLGDWRLAMLETVREYALDQLAASTAPFRDSEAERMRRLHASYFVRLAQASQEGIEGPDQQTWLDRLTLDQDNLRASLNWLLEREDPASAQDALCMLVPLRDFWLRRAHFGEQARWLERALAQGPQEPTLLRGRALALLSDVIMKHGDYPQARAWAGQAIDAARALGDKRLITGALGGRALIEVVLGNYSEARALRERALDVYRELGDNEGIAATLNNLGEAACSRGDCGSAQGFYQESLDLFTALDDRAGILVATINLGSVEQMLGHLPQARASYLRALALAQELEIPIIAAAAALTGLSGVMVAELDPQLPYYRPGMQQVARLSGLTAALLERRGRQLEPVEQVQFDQNVASARAALGEEPFGTAWEEGKALTLVQALEGASVGARHDPRSPSGSLMPVHQTPATASRDDPSGRGKTEAGGRKSPGHGLTTREYEVAILVTQGLANAEIARRLVLSERTVEMHVSNALHKLGLSTRLQLAAWAQDQGLAPGAHR
ncbi:MAG: ATP-binding protein [Chloroflexia bacterium]